MSRLAIKTRTLTDAERDFKGVSQVVKLLESAAWVDTNEGAERVTVYFSSAAPGPDDANAPWFKKLSDGTPLGIYFPDGEGGYVKVAGYFVGETKRFGPFNIDTGELPLGWELADGTNGTRDLQSEWVVDSGPAYHLVVIQFMGYP